MCVKRDGVRLVLGLTSKKKVIATYRCCNWWIRLIIFFCVCFLLSIHRYKRCPKQLSIRSFWWEVRSLSSQWTFDLLLRSLSLFFYEIFCCSLVVSCILQILPVNFFWNCIDLYFLRYNSVFIAGYSDDRFTRIAVARSGGWKIVS